MDYDRRTLLRLGGITAVGTLAGCSSGGDDTDTDAATDTATATTGGTDTATATSTTTPGDGGPPGADQFGGPNDLRASATVTATTLDSDRGAGRYVFSPAVVWLEPGGTVTWEVESGAHSATAYHPDNDEPQRVPGGAAAFDSGVRDGGTFEHAFATEGVHDYFCKPHESLGMVGLVVVGGSQGGPGTTAPQEVSGTAATNLSTLLSLAGVGGDGEPATQYGWQAATWDSYWYSLYNMSTNIAMSGNGVRFPHNAQQREAFQRRLPAIVEHSDADGPPIRNPWLNMAPFTEGSPQFTQRPDFGGEDGRPNAATLRWDPAAASQVVSPSSLAWTHLKGVTWAKNFQTHFDTLPASIRPKFRAQLLATLAQIGTNAALVAGGPQGNGALTNGETLELVSQFRPGPSAYREDSPYTPPEGGYPDRTTQPHHHAAMLWFLSDLDSLAQNGWFGYVNPEPLIPAAKIQQLTDGMARTTANAFDPADVVDTGSTRTAGLLLAALGYYGPQAGSADARAAAASAATGLADAIETHVDDSGRVANGTANQAATQGIVGQGLTWASEGFDGVDRTATAESVLGYLVDDLWTDEAGLFAATTEGTTHTYTARDAGDITGGINAATNALGMDAKAKYARWFDATFNQGPLQRAQRPPSVDDSESPQPPLPPAAGGEFGQAAVYNAEVEYDASADSWSVTDDRFDTEWALYLANQDIWISQWGGDFYQGSGRPGGSDDPPA